MTTECPVRRITHVVISLDVGGMERNVVNQVREAGKLGAKVSIVCLERPGTLAPRARSLGAEVICIGKAPGLRLEIIKKIRRVLKRSKPDVIHTHQIGPLFYTGLACRGMGVPLIVHTEHGKVNYAGRRRTWWLGRIAARFTRVFYCLSEDMAKAVAASHIVPANKIRVMMNGIDTALYRQPTDGGGGAAQTRAELGIDASTPLIGTIGRLTEVKRQDLLLEAFALVRGRIPRAHLLIVGDGPLREALEAKARELGITRYVHFAGYQTDTTPYLHAMDVFTLTSRSEGMPQSLLEACVAKKPVAAVRVGGIPEVIAHGRTGLLAEAGNPRSIADALVELLADPARARQMAERAHERVVRSFDVSRMAADYHRDFIELLNEGKTGMAARRPVTP